MRDMTLIIELMKTTIICLTIIIVSHNFDFDVIYKHCNTEKPIIVMEKGG